MAQIPRTRDILDFQPLPSPKVPLEVGRSGFGQALSNVSQIGFKYGLQARKAEDEVALERLQQNLLDDELEIAQDLDAGAGGILLGNLGLMLMAGIRNMSLVLFLKTQPFRIYCQRIKSGWIRCCLLLVALLVAMPQRHQGF